jgi:hypothetical protein
MNTPSIPPRLWAIQAPYDGRLVALVESNTPQGACDSAARLLQMEVGNFVSLITARGRELDQSSEGEMLFAINVTGVLTLEDVGRLDDPSVRAKVAELDDFEEFIAPIL